MAKAIDYISLTIVLTLLTFAWATLAFHSWIFGLIFAIALTAVVLITIKYVQSKHGKPYSYDRLALEFAIRGNAYVIDLLRGVIKNYVDFGKNYLVLENCVIISAFKFSMLAPSDMGDICAIANKFAKKRVFVMTKGVDRQAYAIVNLENVKFSLVKIKTVFKFLAKHNALPNLKQVKNKFSFKLLIERILSRANFKSYAFSGVVLVLVSFITPLRIYYIVVGSIALVLAILTLTPLGNNVLSSPKVTQELENAIKDNNQISIDDIMQK